MVPEAGIEPARGIASTDFKSVASTYSATRAIKSCQFFLESCHRGNNGHNFNKIKKCCK